MRIFVHDEFDPEEVAMLQALYSRSAGSVEEHVRQAREKGSAKFMQSYYVGYGHSSIGDCGVSTIFIENVSLLACKAVQDNQLYSGQETSTRYIDFSKQPFVNPSGCEEGASVIRTWINFYVEMLEPLVKELKFKYPFQDQYKPSVWEKAIRARAFDILRGYLPAGVCSQLSWSTNLRQAFENIVRLQGHPLEEVQAIGRALHEQMIAHYPSSFSHKTRLERTDYAALVGEEVAYLDPTGSEHQYKAFSYSTNIDNGLLNRAYLNIISKRPKYMSLPRVMDALGAYICTFAMDYGSFRDLQRHRGGGIRMPLLTPDIGFNEWYVENLPEQLRDKASALRDEQFDRVARLMRAEKIDKFERQYYLPMGLNVACQLNYSLPQMVYVAELRSGKTVHPTLRKIAQELTHVLRYEHPELILYEDNEADDWEIKRGQQDIVSVET